MTTKRPRYRITMWCAEGSQLVGDRWETRWTEHSWEDADTWEEAQRKLLAFPETKQARRGRILNYDWSEPLMEPR